MNYHIFLSLVLLPVLASGAQLYRKNEEIKESGMYYQTYFNSCPRQHVGKLVLEIINELRSDPSLIKIKRKMKEEKWEQRYFLSSYEIKVDPIRNMVGLKFQCPHPIFRVHQVGNLQDAFESVLVDNGDLFDTTYEYLYYEDKNKSKDLPYLSLPSPISQNTDLAKEIAILQKKYGQFFKTNLSEIIINESNEMTLIFSHEQGSSAAFLGKTPWDEKVQRLQKIIAHFSHLRKIPSHINLLNPKKVVVKFSYNF